MKLQGICLRGIAVVLACGLLLPLAAQNPPRGMAALKTLTRLRDGTVNLGSAGDAKGVWIPRDRTDLGRRSTLAPVETIPFQPWAKALYDDRQIHELEPHSRCHPSGVSRQFQTPYGVEFVQLSELQRIYIIDVGGPHTYRTVYMDGKPHPDKLVPSAYGHSTGKWEGETLVVDTVGFNETFWLDRTGLPHTERLHTVEKFTRTDFDTIKYQVTIDDLSVYTKAWSGGFDFRWSADTDVFEYICQDNNTATSVMMNGDKEVDFTRTIVP